MADAPTRRDPEWKEETKRPAPGREPVNPADLEWVLERIQQTFETRQN